MTFIKWRLRTACLAIGKAHSVQGLVDHIREGLPHLPAVVLWDAVVVVAHRRIVVAHRRIVVACRAVIIVVIASRVIVVASRVIVAHRRVVVIASRVIVVRWGVASWFATSTQVLAHQ
jgi:hypothetical protein